MKFKDFVTLQRGFDLPKTQMKAGPYPVVGSTSIIGLHSEFKVLPPGVITGRSGSLGKVQYLTTPYWPHNTSLWVKDFKGNYPRFVYYCIQTLDFAQFNAGAGVPTLNRNHLDSLEVSAPGLPTQRKIASILSAYDDLIENNTRRIAILEEMAQAIYREWFVNFRFPGHENVKLVDSVLGTIPEGWELHTLLEIADLRLGKMLDAKKNKGDLMPYLANVNVRWGTFDLQNLREMKFEADELEKYGLRYGDIVMCEGGEPGRCAIWTEQVPNMKIQKAIHRIRSCEKVDFRYLYYNLLYKGQTGQLGTLFTGSTIKHLPGEKLKTVIVEVPTKYLMDTFSKMVEPMACHVEVLTKRNAILRTTRDLLLPKLISGQLDVEDLDIDVSMTAEELTDAAAG